MDRALYISLANDTMKILGDLHDKGILNAGLTIEAIAGIVVEALEEGYDEESDPE
ncbi:hypothetical protein M1D49_07975 [Bacillus sp. PK3-056]|uniref:hypothetical protein n=1 Tax=Niallia circulans TaxID=1397 RepID=UPI0013DDD025|nr:hypothetical protein [Niallia circulans]